jgi:hypothetical protein
MTAVVVGLVAGALAIRRDLRPNPDGLRVPIISALVALAAIAGWYGLLVVRQRRAARLPYALRVPSLRLPAWCLVGVSALAAAIVWTGVAREVGGGLPGRVLPTVGAALALVALGGLLLAIGSGGATDDLRPHAGAVGSLPPIAVLLTVVLGVGAVIVTPVVVESLPVDATTGSPVSGDEGPPSAPPPTAVAWTWERPDGAPLAYDDVVAAATGVAVSTGDGVAVLDGATGEERWHHRRDGAVLTSVMASPSGRWVMATFRPEGDDWTGVRVMAFDGATGEVGFDQLAGGGVFGLVSLPMTDRVLVGGDPVDEQEYEAFSLADGESLWTWEPPDGCVQRGSERFVAGASTVIVALLCETSDEASAGGVAGEVVAVGLDDRSGREVWRHTEPVAAAELAELLRGTDWRSGVEPELESTGDGSAVLLRWVVHGEQDSVEHRVVLGAAEGGVVFDDDLLDFDVQRVDDTAATGSTYSQSGTGRVRRAAGTPELQRLEATACDGLDVADTAARHLVETCTSSDVDSGSATVAVTARPWAGGTPAPPFEVELPVSDLAGLESADTRIGVFPAATVVWRTNGPTLVGLG